MKKALMTLAMPLAALILELLPFSAAMKFAVGPNETQIRTFSFFSPTLWGYASFTVNIAAVLTVVTAVLGVVCLLRKSKKLLLAQFATALLGLVALIMEFAKGVEFITIFGAIVAALLAGQAALAYVMMTKEKK